MAITMTARNEGGIFGGRGVLYAALTLFLLFNVVLWSQSRFMRAEWGNVPPAPKQGSAAMATLGDPQMAYRVYGMMLQNLGDIGGRTTSFSDYNYQGLRDWFFLEDSLDPVSNFVPALAAYYYGSTQKIEDLTPVIDYLAVAGQRPGKNKWRWLAQAVFLARYTQGDLERSLVLAQTLADMSTPDMPAWTRQMPAFIMVAQGDKEAAYNVLMGVLRAEADTLDPAEARLIRDWICGKILPAAEAETHPLCQPESAGGPKGGGG